MDQPEQETTFVGEYSNDPKFMVKSSANIYSSPNLPITINIVVNTDNLRKKRRVKKHKYVFVLLIKTMISYIFLRKYCRVLRLCSMQPVFVFGMMTSITILLAVLIVYYRSRKASSIFTLCLFLS